MPIDKVQRYDAAVEGLRDLLARAKNEMSALNSDARDIKVRIEAVREARNGLENLLDDLLREPPEPAHIEEAPAAVVEPAHIEEAPAVAAAYCPVCGEWDSLVECNRKKCPHR